MRPAAAALLVVATLWASPASAQLTAELAKELDALLAGVAAMPAGRDAAERARRLEQLADVEVRARMFAAARAVYEEAAALRAQLPEPDADLGRLARKQAQLATLDGRPADAATLIETAVQRLRAAAPQSTEFVEVLIEAATAVAGRGDGPRAEQYYSEALAVAVKVEPGSPREARLAELMGDAAVRRNDAEAADQMYSRALAALELTGRDSLDYARVANALAVVTASRNQPDRALELYDAAVGIYETRAADGLPLAQTLVNAGILHLSRQDHATAEAAFRRALAIRLANKASSEDLGLTHASLGLALLEQGNAEEAAGQFTAALAIRRQPAPPLELSALLVNLARAERIRGRPDAAAAAAKEALAIRREHLPQSLGLADAAFELGRALEETEAAKDAVPFHREALALREKLAPGSAEMAASLDRVASALAVSGDPLEARNLFARAIDAWARTAPGSLDHVHAIHEMGAFLVRIGESDQGGRRFREAIDVLERPRMGALTGTPEALAEAATRIPAYYAAPLGVHAERGDAGEAFVLLERRHERRRQARCPACAAPAPVDPFAALKQVLAPGTLLVAYSVLPDATYALVGTGGTPLRVYRLDVTQAALEQRVAQFVARVRDASAPEAPLVTEARALFRLLFGQFEPAAEAAERLLIVPDGVLDELPFAVLLRERIRPPWGYLVEWKPMAFAPSVAAAAGWAAAGKGPANARELLDLDEAALVPTSVTAGAVVALWPTGQAVTVLQDLFRANLATRTPDAALVRAQRDLWFRKLSHPAHWAGYRYYGIRGAK